MHRLRPSYGVDLRVNMCPTPYPVCKPVWCPPCYSMPYQMPVTTTRHTRPSHEAYARLDEQPYRGAKG